MSSLANLIMFLIAGFGGGVLLARLKFPGGAMIGAMLAVMVLKIVLHKDLSIPRGFNMVPQILLGIMVAAGFSPDMLKVLSKVIGPVVTSTVILTGTGVAMGLVVAKFYALDNATAYLSTSPGAMTALTGLAFESGANPPVVLAFSLFSGLFYHSGQPDHFQPDAELAEQGLGDDPPGPPAATLAADFGGPARSSRPLSPYQDKRTRCRCPGPRS